MLVMLFSTVIICHSHAQAKAILTEATVDKFIKTLKPMNKELKTLGYDLTEGDTDLVATVKVMAIMKKYGWGPSFGQEFAAITLGFSYLQMTKNLEKMSQQQRQMMNDMYTKQYKNLVHEDDLELIKPKLSEIEAAFKD